MTRMTYRVTSPARRLAECNNVADLRRLAHRRLPAPMFHYIDGGADDERSLERSISAFDDYDLLPTAPTTADIIANHVGYVTSIDAEKVGVAVRF